MSILYQYLIRWREMLKNYRVRRQARRQARQARRAERREVRKVRRARRRTWIKKNRPIRTVFKHCFVLVTLGWDFPLIRWWRQRPRVRARIARRRKALCFFFQLLRYKWVD